MKTIIIIIILATVVGFFYFNTNVAENIEQDVNNSGRCVEFDTNSEENINLGYGLALKKLLKGCF